MNPAEILVHEHIDISEALALAKNVSEKMAKGKEVTQEFWQNLIIFLRGFADKCHHAKEEDIFLPVVSKINSDFKSCADLVLAEHVKGRGYIRSLEVGVEKFYSGDQKAKKDIIQNVESYVELLIQHIRRENECFPKAMKTVPENIQLEMAEKFERIEQEEIGEGEHEKYQGILEKIKKQI